jgi:oligopeptidase A
LHRDVETLFHEFGHLLHHCLSRVSVRTLAGTRVAQDFVELPSQIMENWCSERDALNLFAAHYETGAPLPEALLERLHRVRTFRAASMQMRQLGFAAVDLALHIDYDEARDGDVMAYGNRILQGYAASELPQDYGMLAGFLHLFSHPVGYAAGYYSYKWAEVLDADAFGRFKREGIFNAAVGRAFRDAILAQGDARDPMDLFVAFMGRKPDPQALLVRQGLAA